MEEGGLRRGPTSVDIGVLLLPDDPRPWGIDPDCKDINRTPLRGRRGLATSVPTYIGLTVEGCGGS